MASETRATLDASWRQFLDTVNSIPEERLTEAGAVGVWSVKDLLGHVAFWDARAAAAAEQVVNGQTIEDYDWQELNDKSAAERASWSLVEARAELERSHTQMLEALERYPDLPDEHWADATREHYDEHVEDLNCWLNGA